MQKELTGSSAEVTDNNIEPEQRRKEKKKTKIKRNYINKKTEERGDIIEYIVSEEEEGIKLW